MFISYNQLVSASSIPTDDDEDEDEDVFEDAVEFYDCVDPDADGHTAVETEEKQPEGTKFEATLTLCQEDERAAAEFRELLQAPGIERHNWSECPDMEGKDAFQ